MANLQPIDVPHAINAVAKVAANCLWRVLTAIEEQDTHQAERRIADYLGGPDAKFTDESERQIEHFLRHVW